MDSTVGSVQKLHHEEECPSFRAVFEAIPAPAFIVDEDVRLRGWNRVGAELLAQDAGRVFNRRGGEALRCLNSELTAEGCGHAEACQDCVIRQAVCSAFQGGAVGRRKTRLIVRRVEKPVELYLRVSASPLELDGHRRVLLILEDISEIVQLQSLLPVCAWCERVRTPENSWQTLAEYVSTRADIDFTHSICSECHERVLPKRDTAT